MRKLPLFLYVCLAAGAAAQSAPAGAAKVPDLHEIMQRVIQRAKVEKEAKLDARYAYRQKRTIDKYNGDGQVVEHTVLLFDVLPVEGSLLYRMIEKNGRPLTAEEQRKEAEKETKFRESLKKARKEDDDVELNEELLARYNFTYKGEELVNGRKALALAFVPKAGELPEKRRMDRVLNRLSGTVWIDQATYALSKVDIALREPVKFFVGLGAMRALHFTAEMSPVDGEWLLPRATAVSYDARALMTNVRVNQHSEYSDYKQVTTSTQKR
jgi:hypothetical protein